MTHKNTTERNLRGVHHFIFVSFSANQPFDNLSRRIVLVLDEATSSVDTRTERHIEHGLARLMKNRTTFVIAHRLSTVRNSDAIMVLERGEIIERGSHDELLALGGRYYELYTGVKELD